MFFIDKNSDSCDNTKVIKHAYLFCADFSATQEPDDGVVEEP